MGLKIQILLVFCCFLAAKAQYGYGRGRRFYGGRRGYGYGGPGFGYDPHFVHPIVPGVVAAEGETGAVAADGSPAVVATSGIAAEVAPGVVAEVGPGFHRGYGYGPGYNRGYGPGYNRGYGPAFHRGYGNGFHHGYGRGFPRGYGPGVVASTGGPVAGAGGRGVTKDTGVAKVPDEVAVVAGGAETAEGEVIGKLDARKLKRNEVVTGLSGSDTVPIKDIFLGGVDDRLVELLPNERYRE